MIRVVIVDDHHLVRQGLRQLLSKEWDIQVVAEATDGRDALEVVSRARPDVVVMDVEMPGMNGIDATNRISRSGCKVRVVMLSVYSDTALVDKALENGAGGYVLKQSVSDELVTAIRAVYGGKRYTSAALEHPGVKSGVPSSGAPSPGAPSALTSREQEILRLIASGNTNRQIAGILSLSVKTVENHRVNLMAKLNVHSLPELIRASISQGLIGTGH
ncbi:MAG: response regulator transcription factor [Gemmatimonadota bacterium]|nr:response regulator transcription factor [Gemmatimonadota bacterium]